MPGFPVHGILQARILEWVAVPSSRNLPGSGIKPSSLVSPAEAGRFCTISATWVSPTKALAWKWKSLSPVWLFAKILELVAFPFSMWSSQPRDLTQVSRIVGRFFTNWATREAQDTGVGSLFLLQWIFPIQELNWGLLHYRQILYPLSYQGSPKSSQYLHVITHIFFLVLFFF